LPDPFRISLTGTSRSRPLQAVVLRDGDQSRSRPASLCDRNGLFQGYILVKADIPLEL
jgi:hypothetical protein